MESANRLLTRRALDVLKTIAMGQYKSAEDAKADMVSEGAPVQTPEEAVEEAVKATADVVSEGASVQTPEEKVEEAVKEKKEKADMVSEGAPVKSPEEALEEAIKAEAAIKSETEANS